jgi:uncharacterized protein YxeA
MNKRLWIVFAVLVIAALGGLVWWKNTNSDGGTSYVDNLNGNKINGDSYISDSQFINNHLIVRRGKNNQIIVAK